MRRLADARLRAHEGGGFLIDQFVVLRGDVEQKCFRRGIMRAGGFEPCLQGRPPPHVYLCLFTGPSPSMPHAIAWCAPVGTGETPWSWARRVQGGSPLGVLGREIHRMILIVWRGIS